MSDDTPRVLPFPARPPRNPEAAQSLEEPPPVASLAEYRAWRAQLHDPAPGVPDLSSLTWMDELLADFPIVLSEQTTGEGAVLLAPHTAVRAPAARAYLRGVLKAAIRALCPACTQGPQRDPEAGWCPQHANSEELDRRIAVAVDGALGQRNDDPAAKEGETQ